MLQRIQSVYLVLVIISCIILNLFSLITANAVDGIYELSIIKTSFIRQSISSVLSFNFPLIISNLFIIVLTLVTLFRYHNRKMQLKLINVILISVLLFIGALIFDYRQLVSLPGFANASLNPILIIVPIQLILLLLAANGIKKDEALVRSADRLR